MPDGGVEPAAAECERGEAASWRPAQAGGVELLVILDGASEPPRDGRPTSLERAATPALDALCAEGALTRLRTVAPWLEAGSEHAIPALLGWTPPASVDRGAVEAAARGIAVEDGERACRIDVRHAADGARADAAQALPALAVALPSHRLHLLGGHRLLAVARAPLPGLDPLVAFGAALASAPASALASAPALASASAGERDVAREGLTLHPWREGIVPPRILDARTVVIAAPGAAAGLARLLGARVITPAGATGRPGSDLAAKAAAALGVLRDATAGASNGAAGARCGDGPGPGPGPGPASVERIVVHVGAPDEAAHEHDAAAKIAAIEAADRDLIAPLAAALRARAGAVGSPLDGTASRPVDTLRVCPDHGCDPADGRHDATPVPCVTWSPQSAPRTAQAGPRFETDAPRAAQTAPRIAADAPRTAKTAPRIAADAPRAAQTAPRIAADAPRAAQTAPRLTERAVAALPLTLPVELATSVRAAA
ncbi:hypothetical protein Q5424_25115 [Conexibacter sp. JD483]|uniref:hypothetical protein n=1 Tax=unclassified Conexibacter TaxID=2627773 RepID=UPI0027201535|nr:MULTISPECIES: hypothetical protein [unclassified Conexibacter]MDO8189333.1 hypothetical protein [Conexibacter sp. CPCC 205706]MDO8201392.1 hypothetical protein [Conexibacter sp. CPCC 205762]MDR9372402.1 hypothetical protein [Conexibacter sp. JD483]